MKKLIVLLLMLTPATANGNEYCTEQVEIIKKVGGPRTETQAELNAALNWCCDEGLAYYKFKNMDPLEKLKKYGKERKYPTFRDEFTKQCMQNLKKEYKDNAFEACLIKVYNECKRSDCHRSPSPFACPGWMWEPNK